MPVARLLLLPGLVVRERFPMLCALVLGHVDVLTAFVRTIVPRTDSAPFVGVLGRRSPPLVGLPPGVTSTPRPAMMTGVILLRRETERAPMLAAVREVARSVLVVHQLVRHEVEVGVRSSIAYLKIRLERPWRRFVRLWREVVAVLLDEVVKGLCLIAAASALLALRACVTRAFAEHHEFRSTINVPREVPHHARDSTHLLDGPNGVLLQVSQPFFDLCLARQVRWRNAAPQLKVVQVVERLRNTRAWDRGGLDGVSSDGEVVVPQLGGVIHRAVEDAVFLALELLRCQSRLLDRGLRLVRQSIAQVGIGQSL